MGVQSYIASLQPYAESQLRVCGVMADTQLVLNPSSLTIEVEAGGALRLVVVHTEPNSASLTVSLARDARLEMVEFFAAEAFVEVEVAQAETSRLKLTTVEVGSANAAYTICLNGAHAESEVNGVLAVGGTEHAVMRIRTNHHVADCRSSSQVRGLAGGNGVGEFHGMVYVAPDAQRTDAYQQNRNMLLSDTARIDTLPQLEIYADDVKCSHGATVGQMDQEAIYYMRQRGIDEQQARRMQLAGFVGDLVMQCGCEALCTALVEELTAKLEKM